ncbi:MAG TPA: hypothetical protein P5181_01545 [Dermatophilaceae bacterium]|nr:hypothetical protein [Dermatophilaceae bacterium]
MGAHPPLVGRWRSAGQGGAAAATLVILAVLLGGCTSTPSSPSATTSPTSTSSSTTTTDAESQGTASTEPGSPTGTPAPPLPNPAPSSIPQVTRPGSSGSPSIAAPPASFAAPATYPDGVVVTLTKATAAVETGNGPGVFPGRELLVLDLEIKNGSNAPISLNQVVVTTYYGLERQLASPVYPGNLEMRDFGGAVAPGATATARYAFAVPKAQVGLVTTVVDFDPNHAAAIFTAKVTT